MKKTVLIILALTFIMGLFGCGAKTEPADTTQTTSSENNSGTGTGSDPAVINGPRYETKDIGLHFDYGKLSAKVYKVNDSSYGYLVFTEEGGLYNLSEPEVNLLEGCEDVQTVIAYDDYYGYIDSKNTVHYFRMSGNGGEYTFDATEIKGEIVEFAKYDGFNGVVSYEDGRFYESRIDENGEFLGATIGNSVMEKGTYVEDYHKNRELSLGYSDSTRLIDFRYDVDDKSWTAKCNEKFVAGYRYEPALNFSLPDNYPLADEVKEYLGYGYYTLTDREGEIFNDKSQFISNDSYLELPDGHKSSEIKWLHNRFICFDNNDVYYIAGYSNPSGFVKNDELSELAGKGNVIDVMHQTTEWDDHMNGNYCVLMDDNCVYKICV